LIDGTLSTAQLLDMHDKLDLRDWIEAEQYAAARAQSEEGK